MSFENKRGPSPRAKPRKVFPSARLRRVRAMLQLEPSGEMVTGRAVLNDLTSTSINLFTTVPLGVGEHLSLALETGNYLYLKGQVTWCVLQFRTRRIISEEFFAYRVGIRFVFSSHEESEYLRRYCEDLMLRGPGASAEPTLASTEPLGANEGLAQMLAKAFK